MDKNKIRSFWTARAMSGSTRWTKNEMLLFETKILNEILGARARNILDLGSGFGELSKSLLRDEKDFLTAVDSELKYSEGYQNSENLKFIHEEINNLDLSELFSCILLFGVVTHLESFEEIDIYQKCRKLIKDDGLLLVKNQCSINSEILINKFSDELQMDYIGRYPNLFEQRRQLTEIFSSVEVRIYPSQFQVFSDTLHTLFICSN